MFTIGRFDVIQMTFLSSSIVVMFLLPMRKVCIPRFLFRLYGMPGSCSNAVLRFEFICNL